MNRNKYEQLIDKVIGEAVLSILQEHGPINTQALIARLQTMEASEKDPQRRDVIADVIADISNNRLGSSRNTLAFSQREWGTESHMNKDKNVYPLFGDRNEPGSSKKH